MILDISWLISGVLLFFRILSGLIVVRVLMSWIIPHAHGPVAVFVFRVTESVLSPIRSWLPRDHSGMMIDWSPLIALILIDVARYVLLQLVFSI